MILWVVLTVCKCSPHPYVAVPHTTTHLPKPHMVSIYGRCTPCVRHHLKPQCTLHTTTPPTPPMPQPINETSVTQNTTNPIKVVRSYTRFGSPSLTPSLNNTTENNEHLGQPGRSGGGRERRALARRHQHTHLDTHPLQNLQ